MDSLDKTFVKALFTRDYYKGYREIEGYVLTIILDILHSMNISNYLQQDFRTVDEVTDYFGLHVQSKPLLKWSFDYMEYMGYLECNNTAYQMSASVDDVDTREYMQHMLQFMPSADIFINLTTEIRARLSDFFEGRINGSALLFGDDEVVNLWNAYFSNQFYGYSVLNHGLGYGITKWFSQTPGSSMLEIGSGTSGATCIVFQMLQDNNLLDSINSIVLSDIVPSLLDLGLGNIMKQISKPPSFEQKILDINKPFGDQRFAEKSFDIIFGVNVLHVAKDLAFSLQELYNHLNKGGLLVIAETIRPVEKRPLHHEFIFTLLDNYHDVELAPETRPAPGFLTGDQWVKNFETTGFNNIECLQELDAHDELDFDIKSLHSFLVLKGQK